MDDLVRALSTGLVILGCASVLSSIVLGVVLAPRGTSLWRKLLWIRDWSTGLPWVRLRIGLLLGGVAILGLSNVVEISGGDPQRYARYVVEQAQDTDLAPLVILAMVLSFPVAMVRWSIAKEEMAEAPRSGRPRIIARSVLALLWQVPALVAVVVVAGILLG